MIWVLRMLQDHEGGVGDEYRKTRKEVGCQWEAPEDIKEAGRRSPTAAMRDASVQVDLLVEQQAWTRTGSSGVECYGVPVRPDEPEGGALLQRHTMQRTDDCPVDTLKQMKPPEQGQNIQFQIEAPEQFSPKTDPHGNLPQILLCPAHMPPLEPSLLGLSAPPSATVHHPSGSLTNQTFSLPSMPLCHALYVVPPPNLQHPAPFPSVPQYHVSPCAGRSYELSPSSAPPPGLIAPLSPQLAEDEEEQRSSENDTGQFRCGKTRFPLNERRGQACNMCSEHRRFKSRSAFRTNRRTEGKFQRTAATVVVAKKTSDKTLQRRTKRFIKVGHLGGQMQRARVKDTQSKDVGEGGEAEEERNRNGEPMAEMMECENEPVVRNWSGEDEKGTKPLMKNPQNPELSGRPRRKTVGPPIRYLLEFEEWSHGMKAASHSRPKVVTVKRKAGRLRKSLVQTKEEDVGLVDEDYGGGGAYEQESGGHLNRKKKTEAGGETSAKDETFHTCQVCGLTFSSCSLLSRHMSGHVGLGWLSCTHDFHSHCCPRRGDDGDGGGVSKELEGARSAANSRREDNRKEDPGEWDKGGAAREEQSPEEVIKEEECEKPILSADWSGCKRARKNPWCRVNDGTTELMIQDTEGSRRLKEKKGGGIGEKKRRCRNEEKKEATEPPYGPRRRLVRPPIRYRTESE